jgi:hypothetical protein
MGDLSIPLSNNRAADFIGLQEIHMNELQSSPSVQSREVYY